MVGCISNSISQVATTRNISPGASRVLKSQDAVITLLRELHEANQLPLGILLGPSPRLLMLVLDVQ